MTTEYIVKIWCGDTYALKLVNEREVFDIIDKSKRAAIGEEFYKISVHRLGDCVLDWS